MCKHSGNIAMNGTDKDSAFMEDNMLVRKTTHQDNCVCRKGKKQEYDIEIHNDGGPVLHKMV